MLRIGVIGAGFVGQSHLRALHESPRCELAGVVDLDPARLDRALADYGAPFVSTDYRELLARPGLDAVVVATHLETHATITVEALGRGLHVLCEKPMARDAAEVAAMLAAAERSGKLLAINFNTRSGPPFREIKELIDTENVGPIRVVRAVYNWSAHHWQPIERMNSFMAGGGPIIDSGVHFFDMIRWFTGAEITRIDASGVTLPPYDAPQHVIAACRLGSGAAALVEVGWLYTKNVKDEAYYFNLTVIADRGTIDYESATGTVRFWGVEGARELKSVDVEKHFEIVYESFARSVEAGRLIDLASGADGAKATEAAFRALASARRG